MNMMVTYTHGEHVVMSISVDIHVHLYSETHLSDVVPYSTYSINIQYRL